jgi:hypothetical protein
MLRLVMCMWRLTTATCRGHEMHEGVIAASTDLLVLLLVHRAQTVYLSFQYIIIFCIRFGGLSFLGFLYDNTRRPNKTITQCVEQAY